MAFTQSASELPTASDGVAEFRPEHGKKLAQRLAEQIEKDIVGAGWPVGSALGREADLLERYPVSRAVLREAIAIVEQDGIAQMRRGVHGGLFVIAPAEHTVVLALRNFLEAAGVSIDELEFARDAIDGLMLQLAARKLNPASMERLRMLDSEMRHGATPLTTARELLQAIAATAQNPLLSTLVAVLAQLGVSLTFYHGVTDKQVDRHLQAALSVRHAQVEALIANDLPGLLATLPAQAESLRTLHTDATQRRKSSSLAREKGERLMQRLLEMGEVNRKVKLADVVALQLQAEIIRLGVVRTVSGRHGGGLYVAAPDPAQTIRRTLLYFGHGQLSMDTIAEVDEAIGLAAITALAKVVAIKGPSHLDPLRRVNENVDGFSAEHYVRKGYLCIGELSGNRVLSLFMQIISGLTALRAPDTPVSAAANAKKLQQLAATQQKIINAVAGGDVNIARRWMIELRKLVTQENPVSRSAKEIV